MASGDVAAAFDLLFAEMRTALADLRERGADAFRRGDNDTVRRLAASTENVQRLMSDLQELRDRWTKQFAPVRSTARRSGRTRSGAHTRGVQKHTRLPRGQRTPNGAYVLPILRALVELGGEADGHRILDRVFSLMRGSLKPVDLEALPSGQHMPRWRNTAMWTRSTMVRNGLMRADSRRGVWAITDRGRALATEHPGLSTDDGRLQAPARAADEVSPPTVRAPSGASPPIVVAASDEEADEDPADAMNRFLRSES